MSVDPLQAALDEAFPESAAPVEPEQAEAPPEASTEEGTPEPQQDARPRDEQGRFLSEADISKQKYLERFGGDVEKALEAAVQADSMIGRQGQQLGDVQRELQELRAQLEPDPNEVQQIPITQETVDWLDEKVYENPQGSAVWAMQNDPSGALYNRVLNTWYAMGQEDPAQWRAASAFERQVEYAQQEQRRQQEMAPLALRAQAQELKDALVSLSSEIPEFPQYAERILGDLQQDPTFFNSLGNTESMMRVLRNGYKQAKFDELNASQAAQTPPGPSQGQQAFVASGSQVQEPEVKTDAERWAEENLDPYLEQYAGSGFNTPA